MRQVRTWSQQRVKTRDREIFTKPFGSRHTVAKSSTTGIVSRDPGVGRGGDRTATLEARTEGVKEGEDKKEAHAELPSASSKA